MSKSEFYYGAGPELGYFRHEDFTSASLEQGLSATERGRKSVATKLIHALGHVGDIKPNDDYDALVYTDEDLGEVELGRLESGELSIDLDALELLVDNDRLIELAKKASEIPGCPPIGIMAMQHATKIIEERREDAERRKHPGKMVPIYVYDKAVMVPWYCRAKGCVEMCSADRARNILAVRNPGEFQQSMLPGFSGSKNDITKEQQSRVRNFMDDRAQNVGPTACRNRCYLEELKKTDPEQLDIEE
jgi:hypothetical protein